MITILSIILSSMFLILALIHFNWAIGGTWGFDASIPTNEKDEKIFNPKRIESFIVGFGLFLFSLFYFNQTTIINISIPTWLNNILTYLIPIIFLLRSIGEFKYVGFFKKFKQTKFADMDTKLFSPLCLIIFIFGFIIAFN